MSNNIYDVVIIGAGPAGLTAYNYCALAGLNVLVINDSIPGGKLVNIGDINNYPSESKIDGPSLALKMYDHSKKLGIKIMRDIVIDVTVGDTFTVTCSKEKVNAKNIIIATGTIDKKGGLIRENEYFCKGVSYCAICDSSLCKGKNICVIGDYDHALEETLYLSSFAKKIYLVCSKEKYHNDALVNEIISKGNIEILYSSKATEILGDDKVNGILINNQKYDVEYVFPLIGVMPSTNFSSRLGITNDSGFIEVDENMETKIKGIYAAGDVVAKKIRQIVTACNDAAIASNNIIKKLK